MVIHKAGKISQQHMKLTVLLLSRFDKISFKTFISHQKQMCPALFCLREEDLTEAQSPQSSNPSQLDGLVPFLKNIADVFLCFK